MRTVNSCVVPRWRACHVTSPLRPISPDVTPATARSCVRAAECWCASIERARSKTRSRGAAISVESSMRAKGSPLSLQWGPDLHGAGGAVGPGVVGDEFERDFRGGVGGGGDGEIEFAAGGGSFGDGAFVLESEDAAEEILFHRFGEAIVLGRSFKAHGNIGEVRAFGLIELLEAIDERAALHGDATSVFHDARVGFQE